MSTSKLTLLIALFDFHSARAATTSISFWAYDQYAQNSPYYDHYTVTNADGTDTITRIDLNDRGWGFSSTGTSSYHVSAYVEEVGTTPRPLRTVGWHEYEFAFNDFTKITSISMDGNIIDSGSYTNTPAVFNFGLHDYYGGAQKTVIDDFEVKIDGSSVYKQNFDGFTLDAGWSVTHLDVGTYTASGDTSTVHSGSGSLVLGATTGGNLDALVAFDLTSVPESSTIILGLIALGGMTLRRNRPKQIINR